MRGRVFWPKSRTIALERIPRRSLTDPLVWRSVTARASGRVTGVRRAERSTTLSILVMSKQNTGFRRVVNATFFSIAGLKAAWRHEAAFRQECMLALVLMPAGLWLGQNAVERSLLVGTVCLVLIIELLNSAIESVVDRVGTDHHALSGQAKDLGSAGVFVSLLLTGLVWGMILWERFA
jgi:diacylglycerol kinase (ATP)